MEQRDAREATAINCHTDDIYSRKELPLNLSDLEQPPAGVQRCVKIIFHSHHLTLTSSRISRRQP